ncbi:MAG: DUF4384 domain-containing protein [Burkholderiaceae bacterium]|nr:DUF4384 domain-containing protein [Burkholderiaceae bacterium]
MKTHLIAASLLLATSAATAQQGYSAKSLFFAEDGKVVSASTGKAASAPAVASTAPPVTKKLASKQLGASYFIRLKNDDGSTRDVLASRSFKSGDRFQLGVKVNKPSYIYVLNQDPDGNVSQIFPVPGQDNYVNAMGTVFLPAKGAFEFDAKPGTEHLLVFLSPSPMKDGLVEAARKNQPDLVAGAIANQDGERCNAPALAAGSDSAYAQDYAAKGIAFKEEAPRCGPAFASKAITFSDDPAPGEGGQVASYVVKQVSSQAGKNLFLKLKLNHQ